GSDLENETVQAQRRGHELQALLRLKLSVTGMNLDRQDLGEVGTGPTARSEAGAAAQHHESRALSHGLDQEPVLPRSQVFRRQVGEDVDVIFPGSELGIVDLGDFALGGAANHDTFDLDVAGRADGAEQVTVVPCEVGALEKQDVQAAAQDGDKRAYLVVRNDELAVLGGDLECEALFSRRRGYELETGHRNRVDAVGDLHLSFRHGIGQTLDEQLNAKRLVGKP